MFIFTKHWQKLIKYLFAVSLITVCFMIIIINYQDVCTKETTLQTIQARKHTVQQKETVATLTMNYEFSRRKAVTEKAPSLTKHVFVQRKTKETKNGSPFIDPLFHMDLSSDANKHIILHWNSPPWLNDWTRSIDMSWCKDANCVLSFDQTSFNKSSAVIFNLPHYGMGDKPPADPEHRNPNQMWAFFTLESPENIWKQEVTNPHWQNVFNWSWTYKPKSDIFHPYGVLISKGYVPKRNYSNIFRMKKKFAAWAVSHCGTPNRREDYVKILQKYVDVDIFGACGQPAPNNLENYLNMNYKFYLGFENSFCDDYMTEKFFHYYPLDIITVVRGSNNYTQYLPEGSFIDTANFSSVTALAKYMKYLAENEEEYIKYLKIKDRYNIHEREFMYKEAMCTICEKLNNLEKNRRVYSDVVEWLGPCHHDIQDLKEDPDILSNLDKANMTVQ